MLKKDFMEIIEAEKYLKIGMDLNEFLAKNPEVGGQEYKAVKRIRKILLKENFKIEENLAGIETSFRATSRKEGKIKIGILMEYDALEDLGHGCGHCCSGAISLVSFLKVNELVDRKKLDIKIDLIGTPAEETYGAKINLKKQGLFQAYDYLLMIHLYSKNIISPKFIAYKALEIIFFDDLDVNLKNLKVILREIKEIKGYSGDFKICVDLEKSKGEVKLLVELREESIGYLRIIEGRIISKVEEYKKRHKANINTNPREPYFPEFKNNDYGEELMKEVYNYYGQEYEEAIEDIGFSDIGALSQDIVCLHPLLSIGMDYKLHSREFSNYMLSDNMGDLISLGSNILSSFIVKTAVNPSIIKEMKNRKNKD